MRLCSSFSLILSPPLLSTLFPYTTLFRSSCEHHGHLRTGLARRLRHLRSGRRRDAFGDAHDQGDPGVGRFVDGGGGEDRKSTRLNSSHRCISYAVFCLKKKRKIVTYIHKN